MYASNGDATISGEFLLAPAPVPPIFYALQLLERKSDVDYISGLFAPLCPFLSNVLAESMTGDSSSTKWWNRLRPGGRDSARSKTRDHSPQYSEVASC